MCLILSLAIGVVYSEVWNQSSRQFRPLLLRLLVARAVQARPQHPQLTSARKRYRWTVLLRRAKERLVASLACTSSKCAWLTTAGTCPTRSQVSAGCGTGVP